MRDVTCEDEFGDEKKEEEEDDEDNDDDEEEFQIKSNRRKRQKTTKLVGANKTRKRRKSKVPISDGEEGEARCIHYQGSLRSRSSPVNAKTVEKCRNHKSSSNETIEDENNETKKDKYISIRNSDNIASNQTTKSFEDINMALQAVVTNLSTSVDSTSYTAVAHKNLVDCTRKSLLQILSDLDQVKYNDENRDIQNGLITEKSNEASSSNDDDVIIGVSAINSKLNNKGTNASKLNSLRNRNTTTAENNNQLFQQDVISPVKKRGKRKSIQDSTDYIESSSNSSVKTTIRKSRRLKAKETLINSKITKNSKENERSHVTPIKRIVNHVDHVVETALRSSERIISKSVEKEKKLTNVKSHFKEQLFKEIEESPITSFSTSRYSSFKKTSCNNLIYGANSYNSERGGVYGEDFTDSDDSFIDDSVNCETKNNLKRGKSKRKISSSKGKKKKTIIEISDEDQEDADNADDYGGDSDDQLCGDEDSGDKSDYNDMDCENDGERENHADRTPRVSRRKEKRNTNLERLLKSRTAKTLKEKEEIIKGVSSDSENDVNTQPRSIHEESSDREFINDYGDDTLDDDDDDEHSVEKNTLRRVLKLDSSDDGEDGGDNCIQMRSLTDTEKTFFAAVKSSDVTTVRDILKINNIAYHYDENCDTALHIASRLRNHELLMLLLEYGSNPNLDSLTTNTPPLTVAASSKDPLCFETLLGLTDISSYNNKLKKLYGKNLLHLLVSLTLGDEEKELTKDIMNDGKGIKVEELTDSQETNDGEVIEAANNDIKDLAVTLKNCEEIVVGNDVRELTGALNNDRKNLTENVEKNHKELTEIPGNNGKKITEILENNGKNLPIDVDKGDKDLTKARKDDNQEMTKTVQNDRKKLTRDAEEENVRECINILKMFDRNLFRKYLFERDEETDYPLITAIKENCKQGVCSLMLEMNDNGYRFEDLTDQGGNLIHLAAQYSADCLREILPYVANKVNDVDANGWTPLMYAAELGKSDCICALFEAHASIHVKERDGVSPLHLAAAKGDLESIRFLLQCGHSVLTTDTNGWPPLLYANFQSDKDCVIELFKKDPSQLFCLSNLINGENDEMREKNKKIIQKTLECISHIDKYYTVFNNFIGRNLSLLDANNLGVFITAWKRILSFQNKAKWLRNRYNNFDYGRFTSSFVKVDRSCVLKSAMDHLKGNFTILNMQVSFKGEAGSCLGPKREFMDCLVKDTVDAKKQLFTSKDNKTFRPLPNTYFLDKMVAKSNKKEHFKKDKQAVPKEISYKVVTGCSPATAVDVEIHNMDMSDIELLHASHAIEQMEIDDNKQRLDEIYEQLRFLGRFVARVILDSGENISLQFTNSFVQKILGIPLNHPECLSKEDYEYYRNIKENEVDGLDIPFSAPCLNPWTGKYEEISLTSFVSKEDDIVTESNKEQFLESLSSFLYETIIVKEVQQFRSGFYEYIDKKDISMFTADEFSLLLNGVSKIDVDDWKRNTRYLNWKSESKEIIWFWRLVTSLKEEEKALLLKFSTGSPCVPIGGFANLRGFGGGTGLFTIQKSGNSNKLPGAATCFNTLTLPAYSSEETLRDKLLIAIRHGCEGFVFG